MSRIIIGVVCVAVLAAGVLTLPVETYLSHFLAWVQTVGPWGAVILVAAYIPAALLFVPGSLLTLGAGFVFGVGLGTVAVSLGSTLGAAAAFLLGRTFARHAIEAKVAGNARFHALDQAVKREGFKIVLLMRLSPVFPFNLLNYAFGLTQVSFRDYILASWIGMLPGTLMYVYLGSAAQNLAALSTGQATGGAGRQVLFGLGLLATIVVTVFVTRLARKALDDIAPTTATARSQSPARRPVQDEQHPGLS
jgi:uncharacterized membrane protein YdjX (TVP38/TMEM64 family)